MIIDYTKLDSMSSDEIENMRVECLKELQTMEDNADLVKEELDYKSRAILQLEIEKKDLSIAYGKAKQNIKKKKTDIEILQTKYWQSRR